MGQVFSGGECPYAVTSSGSSKRPPEQPFHLSPVLPLEKPYKIDRRDGQFLNKPVVGSEVQLARC